MLVLATLLRAIIQAVVVFGSAAGSVERAERCEDVPVELAGCQVISPTPSSRLLVRTHGGRHNLKRQAAIADRSLRHARTTRRFAL
jgi:hypothetical protein